MPRRPKQMTAPDTAHDLDYANPLHQQAAAKLELAQRRATARYQHDPWAFVSECVWTLDQITGKTLQFPNKEHAAYLARLWLQEPLLLVGKSRRMMVTWLMVALNYWLCRFRGGCKILFFAKEEGKDESHGSNELVWRAKFIHDHMPMILGSRPVDYHTGRLYFPDTHSEIIGLAQGADQARMMTVTSAFVDEAAHMKYAYDTYVAMRPTIEGGGRLTMVSSANPGFFAQMFHDQSDFGGAFSAA